MYPYLNAIGITDTDLIEKYTVRTEGNADVLKVYYAKNKGELFARSEKFKYPRQKKRIMVDSGTHTYSDTTEVAPALRFVVEELDKIVQREVEEVDVKEKILTDLRHLEKVVANKIAEIEEDLKKL
ncbi:DUF3461 family protein [Reinekea marinisedimentorum]|uniref:Uncharacterized protein DUF3461 n=1 Tax=Reinekea marinisedimentorum TaxID=230495 RepID=A0A4R3IDZ2_9GAMM|nr:DUF3461 family protein [Reinekea marinisedimentorum]TCS44094.1 uncharacterized protein DUF3461 [Reinekea marinisedimentorum]